MTENQPARLSAAAVSDWQDIYLRDKDGRTDVIFDGGVTGWPVHVTDSDLRLLLARPLSAICYFSSRWSFSQGTCRLTAVAPSQAGSWTAAVRYVPVCPEFWAAGRTSGADNVRRGRS